MKQDKLEKIRQALNLDKEKCTLFPLTERILRIFCDDEIKQHDVDLIKYKMRKCCDVKLFNPHTLDLLRKRNLNVEAL
jgi:hypothetical protein